MKKGFRVAFLALPWLLLGILTYWLLAGNRRPRLGSILITDHYDRACDFFAYESDGVTEVKIYRLAGTPEQGTEAVFSVNNDDRKMPVFGMAGITGAELEEFLKIWSSQQVIWGGGGICHDPPYGFRLFRRESVAGEASVCWMCANCVIPYSAPSTIRVGFNVHHPAAKKLLEFCDRRLPYHRPSGKPEAPEKIPDASGGETR